MSDPVRLPSAVGVKVILMVHELPPAREEPQLFVWAKSPVTTIPVTVKGKLPELVSTADPIEAV